MDRHDRASKIFLAASELPSEERSAYLDEACGDDAALRQEVEKLLAHDRDDSFLEPLRVLAESTRPPDTVGDFRILREIGKGGMGTVYEAEQVSLQRKVALKILPAHLSFSDEAVRKFLREAEAGARQKHPGIVAIHAVGEHEGFHYIAQELVEGELSLTDKIAGLRKTGDQPSGYFRKAARLIFEVADALQHAHDSGVIHRDIKPSNILLAGEWTPKVTDFGLARIEDALGLSRTGDLAGTPYYMSPEQAMSRRVGIDKRTDIYSLGVTLYEMLTLRRPFEGKTSHEILKKIVLIDPPESHKTNPKVPRDLSVICSKAMEKEPARRYQSMEEFGDDLERFLHGDAILAKPAGLVVLLWKRVRRKPVVSAAISMAVLAVVALVLFVLLWSYPQISHERDIAEAGRKRAVEARREAIEQRNIAEAEKRRAIAAEKKADEQYSQIIRLSDSLLLSNLERESDRLWPAYPEKMDQLKDWRARAEELLGRLEIHRATLEILRKAAMPPDEAAIDEQTSKTEAAISNARVYEFSDSEIQWQYKALVALVKGLERMMDGEDGELASVKARLDFASTIEKRSIDDHREAWDIAIASIASREECPQYDGLVIDAQTGYVPIGRDPKSGLWEFAHLQTGEIPKRGEDGTIIMTEEMGMVFVLIPGGAFNMGSMLPSDDHPLGSPNVDPQTEADEDLVHEVTIIPFFMSKYEMTQGQWQRFTKKNPSFVFARSKFGGKSISYLNPVEQVSWKDSVQVLFRLNLRLPSEAEWEYAARAGTTTVFWTGDDKKSLRGAANLADLFCKQNGGSESWMYEEWLDDGYLLFAPVGSFLPNPFGLHDVHGNAWEWCQDCYLPTYEALPTDGSAFEWGNITLRVIRGGSCIDRAQECRCSSRLCYDPDFRGDGGIRAAYSLRYE